MRNPADDPSVTAYALGELGGQDAARVEGELNRRPEMRDEIEETRSAARTVTETCRAAAGAPPQPVPALEEARLDAITAPAEAEADVVEGKPGLPSFFVPVAAGIVLAGIGAAWALTHPHAATKPLPASDPYANLTPLTPPGGDGSAKDANAAPPPLPDSAFDVHPVPVPRDAGTPAPSSSEALVPAAPAPSSSSALEAVVPATPPPPAVPVDEEALRAERKARLDALKAKVDSERRVEAAVAPPPAPGAFPEITIPAKPSATIPLASTALSEEGRFRFTPGPLQAVTVPVVSGFTLPEVVPLSGIPAPLSGDGVAEEGPGVKMVDFSAGIRAPLPVVVLSRVLPSPWHPNHDLVVVALQPVSAGQVERPRANLVFLVDISTSMSEPDRLALFKTAFSKFLDGLRPDDEVSLVVYAGASARWLGVTPVHERETIRRAFDKLAVTETDTPGASLQMAYDLAHQGFLPGGFNRVIAVTDGDLNLGIGEKGGLHDYVALQARDGVTLSLIGMGRQFAINDKVKDLIQEGRGLTAAVRTLGGAGIALDREVTEAGPVAVRDVRFELPVAPAVLSSYRLLGYQNQFPVTGSGAVPRPNQGLVACYETERAPGAASTPLELNLRYRREGGNGNEETYLRPVGAPDEAAPEIVKAFEAQVAELRSRFANLQADDGKGSVAPLTAEKAE